MHVHSKAHVTYAWCRVGSDTGSRPSSVRMGIRGERVGMSTKAALEPSQLETHITSLMRASFGRLKVQLCVQAWSHALQRLLITFAVFVALRSLSV